MKNNFLNGLSILNLILMVAVLAYLYQNNKIELDLSEQVLKVRGVVVVDSLGVERVIIGAPLPPPQLHGLRYYRGDNSEVSGVMLYDAEGQERSGYVTDNDYGNVFLTLDSKTSQRMLFVAEPQGATTLRVWGLNGNRIDLGATDGEAFLKGVNSGNEFNLIEK